MKTYWMSGLVGLLMLSVFPAFGEGGAGIGAAAGGGHAGLACGRGGRAALADKQRLAPDAAMWRMCPGRM